uniref:Uncharacterized protein n=1 Tax=Nothoprocta perdicaria TaxID=30464 RepID=A0A8C6ZUH6_NOTPE
MTFYLLLTPVPLHFVYRTGHYLPEFSAGLELLSRYEDAWASLHRGAKDCAKAGEVIKSKIITFKMLNVQILFIILVLRILFLKVNVLYCG